MRFVLALATFAAFLVSGAAAQADLVVSFNKSASSSSGPFIPVTRTNGLAESSSGSLFGIGGTEAFSGSFTADPSRPLDLIAFEFAYETPQGSTNSSFSLELNSSEGATLATGDISLPANPFGSSTGTFALPLGSVPPFASGSFSMAIQNGSFVNATLPTTSSIAGSSVDGMVGITATAVPEPSTAGGLALLACGGAGFFVRRRLRASRN